MLLLCYYAWRDKGQLSATDVANFVLTRTVWEMGMQQLYKVDRQSETGKVQRDSHSAPHSTQLEAYVYRHAAGRAACRALLRMASGVSVRLMRLASFSADLLILAVPSCMKKTTRK